MARFLFVGECVLLVLAAIPFLIIAAGICFSFVIVLRTFYEALAEQEIFSPVAPSLGSDLAPAYKLFAFGGGWRLVGSVLQQMPMRVYISSTNWIDATETVRYLIWSRLWFAPFVGWLAILGLYIAAYLQYVIVFLFTALFLFIHILLLIAWASTLSLCLGLLLLLRFCWNLFHSYLAPCPHCYQRIEMSIYVCPTCRTRHPRLRPGLYGLLTHRCRSCRTRLPTLDILGRKRLARLCPSCLHVLNDAVGRSVSCHIALVGASASGKTSYLIRAIHALCEQYRTWQHIGFADKEQRKQFELNMHQLRNGEDLSISSSPVPEPYLLRIRPTLFRATKLLYFYDPVGKVFATSEHISRQEYYRYTQGLLFLIDGSTLSVPTPHAGELQAMQTYDRMMQLFETFVGFQRGMRYTHPIAVVVTKIDLPRLSDAVESETKHALMQQHALPGSEREIAHQMVRAFLCERGLDNMVRDLESHFAHIRYFCCAVLEASDVKDGNPLAALAPLEWLLRRTGTIPR
jgi:GTPase SAR1 family protein